MKIIGRQENVGVALESVRGTAVNPTYWLPWLDLKVENKVKTVLNEQALGRIESSDGMAVVEKWSEAEIRGKLKDESFGLLLLSLFGTDTPAAQTAPNASVYDHVFSVLQSASHPTLTLSHKSSNDAVAYSNMLVESIRLAGKAGDYIYYTAKLVGKPSAAAVLTPAYTAENDFVSTHLTFKKATTQAGLAAAAAISIREFEIEITQNPLMEYVLGSVSPNDVLNQSFDIKGSVTLIHNDATFANLQNNETYNAFRFDLKNTGVTIGTSANPELKIDLHRCRVTDYERNMTLNNIVEEKFNFTAHYSLTDSKMATATLTNLEEDYSAES
jgi:hypothetical protein